MSDEARARMDSTENLRPKPRYQPPQVIRMGEIARGHGNCNSGPSPSGQGQGKCEAGVGAKGQCQSGISGR